MICQALGLRASAVCPYFDLDQHLRQGIHLLLDVDLLYAVVDCYLPVSDTCSVRSTRLAGHSMMTEPPVGTIAELQLVVTTVQEMKAFWVPSQGKEARQVLDKPDQNTYCPASGKKLRLKDLIAVKFTKVPEEDSGVYMDPVTKDTFTNASSIVVLKPTGKRFLKKGISSSSNICSSA